MGNENSTVTSTGQVDSINGGATRGANLFHSFQEFNVDEGRAAVFTNPSGIENILTRVTGANPSNIFGTLGVAGGNANLFLINPNGIIFGLNARLDVGGSFVGTTASSLNFADSSQFSATAPQSTPLLTVSVPLGLQFGEAAGRIQNQSQATNSSAKVVGLQVQPGKTLALVGGDVALERGSMTAAGGRIELGSVAGTALVNLNSTQEGWTLGYESTQNFQDIQLSQQALVDASGEGGGNIQVRGRQIRITDGSKIQAKTLGSKPGGNLAVTASEAVELIGTSADGQERSSLTTETEGDGAAGALTITAKRLLVQNGGLISTGTFPRSRGSGGNLTVTTSDSVMLMGEAPDSKLQSRMTTQTQSDGSAGDLTITTGKLIVQDGGQVSAGTFPRSRGSGGNLTVTVPEFVELTGVSADGEQPSRLTSHTTGAGDAKDLTINTGKLIIQAGGQISAGTESGSTGAGGNLTVNASDSVEVMGESVNGRVNSRLTTRTEGAGDAKDLTINTGKLIIQAGGQVSADTESASTGSGGNLTVTASDSVEVIGRASNNFPSSLSAKSNGARSAGDLAITTEHLSIRDGAEVTVSGVSSGDAGNLVIASRSTLLDKKAAIKATTASGEGGNITLQEQDLILMRRDSKISTEAGSSGNGGNIDIIDAGLIVAVPGENNDITANAFSGSGGKVTIDANSIFGMIPRSREDLVRLLGTNDPTQLDPRRLPTNDITAISQENPSLSGLITINTLITDPSSGLVNLPTVPLDTEVAQACNPGGSQSKSEFVVTGRGGLPPSPNETLSSDAIQVDWVTLNPEEESRSSLGVSTNTTAPEPNYIVEAQGWAIANNGDVILTASAAPVLPANSWQTPAKCQAK